MNVFLLNLGRIGDLSCHDFSYPLCFLQNDDALPLEILSVVASGRDELKAMREVSKSWKAGFEDSVSGFKVLQHQQHRLRGNQYLPSVSHPLIHILSKRFPKLTSLDLGESPLQEVELVELRYVTQLKSLTLGCDRGRLAHLGLVGDARPLAWRVKGCGLMALQYNQLTCLDLRFCTQLCDSALKYLEHMPLTSLSLHGCTQISGFPGLQYLQALPLTALNLHGCNLLKPSSLQLLKQMPLKHLDLGGCHYATSLGLQHLRGLPLVSLSLEYEWRTRMLVTHQPMDSGLEALAGMSALESLNISGCDTILDGSLRHLADAPLTSLDLSDCGGLSVASLARFREKPLTSLALAGWDQLTDEGLAQLKGLPLTSLDISFCHGVTDAGLGHLTGLPLTHVDLFGCRGVSPEAVLTFRLSRGAR